MYKDDNENMDMGDSPWRRETEEEDFQDDKWLRESLAKEVANFNIQDSHKKDENHHSYDADEDDDNIYKNENYIYTKDTYIEETDINPNDLDIGENIGNENMNAFDSNEEESNQNTDEHNIEEGNLNTDEATSDEDNLSTNDTNIEEENIDTYRINLEEYENTDFFDTNTSKEDEYIHQITESLNHENYGGEVSLEQTTTDNQKEDNLDKVEEESKYQFLKWFGIGAGVCLILMFTIFFIIKMNQGGKKASSEAVNQIPSVTVAPSITPSVTEIIEEDISPTPTQVIEEEEIIDEVIHIVLLGEENIDGYYERGETDLICIASLNITDHTMSLTSILKDTYVQVPNYGQMVISKVYQKGGARLLYSTIKENFNIEVNGYVLTSFKTFEQLVDDLGGVWITLTEEEAQSLNTSNYVSDSENRNLSSGLVRLNGNQALGYCRIPIVYASDDKVEDYSRVSRQQNIFNSFLLEVRSKSYFEMVSMLNKIFQHLRTDLTKNKFQSYVEEFLEVDYGEIEIGSIPIDSSYSIIIVNEEKAIVPDLALNQEYLHYLIYGEDVKDNSEETIE